MLLGLWKKSKLIKEKVDKVHNEINKECTDDLQKKFQLFKAILERNM